MIGYEYKKRKKRSNNTPASGEECLRMEGYEMQIGYVALMPPLKTDPAPTPRISGMSICRLNALLLSSSLRLAAAAPLAEVRPAPGKGMGAFAAIDFRRGELVCAYEGEQLTGSQVTNRYGSGGGGEYLFEVAAPSVASGGVFIDGAASSHFSRFINHAEQGNLEPRPVLEAGGKSGRVDLVAVRRIRAGDELSFDYGEVYWVCASGEPAAATDSRRESIRLRRALRRQQLELGELDEEGRAALRVIAAGRTWVSAVRTLLRLPARRDTL